MLLAQADTDGGGSFSAGLCSFNSFRRTPLIPPQDLDLPPPGDDALERVLALLQTDANLCARLRAELAQLS
jgi:hypothetical protein